MRTAAIGRGAPVVALLLFATACAQGSSGAAGQLVMMRLPSPDSQVRQAVARLFDTKTGEFTETLTAHAAAGTLVRTTTGQFDLERRRASMATAFTADQPEAVQAVLGHPADLATLSQHLVRDASVMYLTKPSWIGAQSGRWFRYQGQWLGGLGRQWSDALGVPWDPDYDMSDPSPTPLLALPQKMGEGGAYASSAPDVAGYEVSVPLSEARQVIGASTLGGDSAGAAGGGPGEMVPVRVEVGPDGSIVRLHLDATRLVQRTAAGAPAGVQYSYDLALRRLGQPVDIAVPPAGAQVSGGQWVQDLRAGACLGADADVTRRLFVAPVPCAGAHRYEVYARVALGTDVDPYPGQRRLRQLAQARCGEQLASFLGAAGESALRYWASPPGENAWLQGAHTTPCVLDAGHPVAGTLRGSGG
jgi:hypothetical protein